MSKRLGAVIKFRPGVSRADAEFMLKHLHFVLDLPKTKSVPANSALQDALDAGEAVRYVPGQWVQVPFEIGDLLKEFDDEDGDPVWYIP